MPDCRLLITFAISLDLDHRVMQERKNGSKLTAALMVFLKEFFEKDDADDKTHEKLPGTNPANTITYLQYLQLICLKQMLCFEIRVDLCAVCVFFRLCCKFSV